MKRKLLIIFILFVLPSISFCQEEVDTISVFYLGGQSNMDGYGYNSGLPKYLNKRFENVWIFHGNPAGDDKADGGLGIWDILKPGHGTGFSSDGLRNNLSDRFGVELSFADKLQNLYPGKKIAIIKYSGNGTSIDSLAAGEFGSWEPDFRGKTGINQYDHFLKTLNNAFSVRDINGDGKLDFLVPRGIIWMQGESDAAFTEEIAARYYFNLKRLMDLFRASLRTDDLPIVLGKISDSWNSEEGKVWKYGELVQYAQEKFVRTEVNAAIVRNTKYYKYSDPWHYDNDGFIDLGSIFAEEIYKLNDIKNK